MQGGKRNQLLGKQWEDELIDAYYRKGFQPIKIATEIKGTCFDIVCIKDSLVLCIEAKHITGDKLYFKSSGLEKKVDELNHFIKHCNTNVYIYVKSDKTGMWFNSWLNLYPIFKEKGYVTREDCIKFDIKYV